MYVYAFSLPFSIAIFGVFGALSVIACLDPKERDSSSVASIGLLSLPLVEFVNAYILFRFLSKRKSITEDYN